MSARESACDSGNGNMTGVPELAVEEARRGSRIWLVVREELHRLDWMYGLGGAGIDLVLHAGGEMCDLCKLVN